MRIVVLILAALLTIASILPLVRKDDWWIRVFDFPRGQIFVLGLLVLATFFLVWNVRSWAGGVVLGLLVLALATQAYWIFPYTPLSPKQVLTAPRARPDSSVSLLVANVLMSNRNAQRLLEIIRELDPDVVLTLEPDAWWEEQLRELEADRPYTIKEPLDNRYGMLLHSRLELVDPEVKFLFKEGIPSFHTRLRLPTGDLVWLHCVHPEPPSPTEAEETTERDAELLIVGAEVKERREPTIVAGDLNDVAWSHTTSLFQKISGLLDPRRGRGLFNTYHAQIPLMRWPLDHVFHSDTFMLGEMRRLPDFGSDHFPVYVRLVLQPDADAVQEEPDADREDLEEAGEKMDEVTQKEAL